ncbi:N-acetyltransferase [Halolactibacillus miurensis]|uniref:N-acetyltransferase n=1 Tax=Halolactibacillus miurensis TaxID=306541 RepID=A0A1I6SZ42_9BACI|nr:MULTISPECIES: GNAT family N-acetyltransferase [Halolactibacillus]GEM04264.1 N-acetyltransferase [Halolactibacillus miurensis]SFS82148.1 Ribosomal protein S18 acetylase RimI [Halolactibacillus miurensis]
MTQIRQANEVDIPVIQKIATESWHHTYETLIPLDIINQCIDVFYHHDRLIKRIKHHTVLVAIKDQQLIGFIDASNDKPDAFLYALYLKPDVTHKGIGSELFKEYLRCTHPKTVTVDVERGNDPAVCFYEKHGFKYERAFVDVVFDYSLQTECYVWREIEATATQGLK